MTSTSVDQHLFYAYGIARPVTQPRFIHEPSPSHIDLSPTNQTDKVHLLTFADKDVVENWWKIVRQADPMAVRGSERLFYFSRLYLPSNSFWKREGVKHLMGRWFAQELGAQGVVIIPSLDQSDLKGGPAIVAKEEEGKKDVDERLAVIENKYESLRDFVVETAGRMKETAEKSERVLLKMADGHTQLAESAEEMGKQVVEFMERVVQLGEHGELMEERVGRMEERIVRIIDHIERVESNTGSERQYD